MIWLDAIGACLALCATFLFTNTYRTAWLFGLVAVMINFYLYFNKGIYARLFLECFYLVTMLGGFKLWGGLKKAHRPIVSLSKTQLLLLLTGWLIVSALVGTLLAQVTPSTIPYLDATSTTGSMIAQLLLCFKVLECWIFWLVVDSLAAWLQFQKDIPFHASVHIIYLAFAVYGYIKWHRTKISGTTKII